MKKYDLLRSGDSIIRVLEIEQDRVLVIDCIKRNMPVWVDVTVLESYSECTCDDLSECTTDELFRATGFTSVDVDTLDAEQRKVMYERYTMIAPILSFISEDKMRSRLVGSVSAEYGVSKQTIRSYLWLYLPLFVEI